MAAAEALATSILATRGLGYQSAWHVCGAAR